MPPYSVNVAPSHLLEGDLLVLIEHFENIRSNQAYHYLPTYLPTYNTLRIAVREAWDAVVAEQLDALIDEMQDRCQAVIDKDGKHTKC